MSLRRIVLPFACIAAMALAGCGFHPRAELVVPAGVGQIKVVSGDPYSQLAENISRALSHANAALGCTGPAGAGCAGTPPQHAENATADAVAKVAALRIVSETWTGAPLSIDAFAHAHEYFITYVVKFSFTAADGTEVSPLQEVRLQRDFVYDDTHALGSASEQATIHEELQRDMAATIMRRIGIALRHYTPKS